MGLPGLHIIHVGYDSVPYVVLLENFDPIIFCLGGEDFVDLCNNVLSALCLTHRSKSNRGLAEECRQRRQTEKKRTSVSLT